MLQQPGPLKGQAATPGGVDTQQQQQQQQHQHQQQQQLQAGWSVSNCMPSPNHMADGWSTTYSAAPMMKEDVFQAEWSASHCMPSPTHMADWWSATYTAALRRKPPGLEADVLRADMWRALHCMPSPTHAADKWSWSPSQQGCGWAPGQGQPCFYDIAGGMLPGTMDGAGMWGAGPACLFKWVEPERDYLQEPDSNIMSAGAVACEKFPVVAPVHDSMGWQRKEATMGCDSGRRQPLGQSDYDGIAAACSWAGVRTQPVHSESTLRPR